MEPFRLTSQSIAFIAVMAVVAAVVAVAAPFGAIALGLLAILAIGMVLIKAMFRARRWWPMTEVEGTIALSSLVLVVGGLLVIGYSIVRLGDGWHMMVGWPTPYPGTRTGAVTRSVNYSDPAMQQRLKEALREASIPFSVKMQDGKEFVGWAPEHNDAAQAVDARIKAGPLGNRNVHFPDAKLREEFVGWLRQKGVKHEVAKMDGKDFIGWDEGAGDLVREFMESRSSGECKGKVAAGKSEAGRC